MANCGYHSPQFSEDIAWLPPWLQPHQIPVVKDCAKDDGSISLLSCKNFPFLEESTSDKQNSQCFSRNDAGYTGCRLHLSGDDSSCSGSTPSAQNVLHFSLHLSSAGTSQLSSGQFNDKLKITNCHTNFRDEMKTNSNEGSPSQVIPEAQAVRKNGNFKNKEDSKTNSEPLSKIEGNNGQRSRKKVISGNLRNANIDDVIELSIAASEAMVISEMTLNSSLSDPLPASAVLEAAFHVKEARKQLFSEALCASSDRELDESNFLLDLDESTMVDAFDDVGLCITRDIHSPENSIHGTSDFKQEKTSQSSSSCDQGTHVSESRCLETQNENLKNQDVEYDAKNSPTNHDLAIKPLNFLPPLPITLGSGDEHVALVQDSTQNVDKSGVKEGAEETPGTVKKVGGVAVQENGGKRKHVKKLFNQETSFISESIDTTRKCSLSESLEAGNEIIASSGTPFITRSTCPSNTIRKNNDIVSQDHMESPFLSSMDPLCSVVPCSISFDDARVEEDGKEPVIIKTLRDQTSDGLVEDNVPSKTFAPREEFDFPKIVAENSGLLVHRKCSSLKNYSMIMPALDKLKAIAIPFPTNGNHFKYDDKVTIGEPSFKETNDDDIDVLFRHHESLPPLMLNNKKHRVKACKAKFNGDGADQNLIRFTEVKSDYGREATTLSNVPLKSSLSLRPADKQCLQKKRVQFVETKRGTKRTRTSKGLKSTNRVCRSQGRTSRRMDSNLERKSQKGDGKSAFLSTCAKEMIFQGLEFLLTGFSRKKEKEIESLIRKFGGYVLFKVPTCSPDLRENLESVGWKPPIILSPKKVPTAKFLYGCATNSWMLNFHWLVDSLQAGYLLPPGRYLNLPIQPSEKRFSRVGEPLCFKFCALIFDGIGILLSGKVGFCSKFSNIVRHGGGQVFMSLEQLIQNLKVGSCSLGVILVESEASVSRHLRHCGLENNIQTLPASWIICSLFCGKLIPLKKDRCARLHRIKMPTFPEEREFDMSQEI